MVNQIINFSYPLHEIDEAHCCALSQSVYNYKFDSAHILMTVYLSAALDSADTTSVTAVHYVDDKDAVKDQYCMCMLACFHQPHLVEMFRDEDYLATTAELLSI